MRIVLVLGAGATLAQAEHLGRLGRTGEPPPLDATFFLRLQSTRAKLGTELRAYAKNLLGFDPFAPGAPAPGMEAFFKELFYDFVVDRHRSSAMAPLYGELVSAYRQVLLETTNWVTEDVSIGPVPELLRQACESADYVDIITFNHDLLVENVLADLAEARTRWCLRHGYGHFAAKRRFTSQAGTSRFADPRTCEHPRPIRLFKLHGSLNWYVTTDAAVPDASVLRGERDTNQRIMITRRRRIPRTLRRKGDPFSWPVVIPPIYAKQTFITNFMAPVWQDARRALRACNRLVFFGYSMPPLDIEAEMELKRALAKNTNLRFFDVVNPSADTASRYAQAFPRLSVRWHGALSGFLRDPPF
jgi:hypothetical protein